MTSQHTHLTPDLPPIVDVPDLPGAAEAAEHEPASPAGSGNGSGAHQEGDGRHQRAAEGSGG